MSRPRRDLNEATVARFHERIAAIGTSQGPTERVVRAAFRIGSRIAAWHTLIDMTGLPVQDGRAGAGCVVAVAPHRSWLEPFLLLSAWPLDAAKLIWLADGHTVTSSWWRRLVLPRLGVVPIERRVGGPRVYAEVIAAALAAGAAVVIFPEIGPPSPPEATRELSRGFAYVARRAGAPIVPVAIGGTHHIVRGSTFSVDALPPIPAVGPAEDAFRLAARTATQQVVVQFRAAVEGVLPARERDIARRRPGRDRWAWLDRLVR